MHVNWYMIHTAPVTTGTIPSTIITTEKAYFALCVFQIAKIRSAENAKRAVKSVIIKMNESISYQLIARIQLIALCTQNLERNDHSYQVYHVNFPLACCMA